MSDREEELKKLLGREEEVGEEQEASRWNFRDKMNWRFNLGRKRWGFWILVGGFILFLVTQFIIRPMIGG